MSDSVAKNEAFRLYRDEKWPKELLYKEKYEKIRQELKEAFDGIKFIEDTHRYFYKGQELVATSNVCHLFRNYFDSDVQAERCSNKYWDDESSKYYHMTKQEILDAWEANSLRATTHGTKVHLFGQNVGNWLLFKEELFEGDFEVHVDEDGREYVETTEPKEIAILKYFKALPLSIIPIQFEIQMFSLKYGISGTADLLFLHDPDVEKDDNYDVIKNRLYLMDYKGLPIDTPILTTEGWKTMGTISEGDFVYDKDGKQVKVLHTSDIHYNPCYRITFDNGDSIVADHEHRWLVNSNGVEMVLTTYELVEEDKKDLIIQRMSSLETCETVDLHITSVEKTDTVPTRCIEVDSQSHTYLCGFNMLVTHNTNADLYKAFDKMLEPFQEMDDNDLGGYLLQAAIYSKFIEDHGFKFVARCLIWLLENGEFEKVPLQRLTDVLFNYLDNHPLKELMEERRHG